MGKLYDKAVDEDDVASQLNIRSKRKDLRALDTSLDSQLDAITDAETLKNFMPEILK